MRPTYIIGLGIAAIIAVLAIWLVLEIKARDEEIKLLNEHIRLLYKDLAKANGEVYRLKK